MCAYERLIVRIMILKITVLMVSNSAIEAAT